MSPATVILDGSALPSWRWARERGYSVRTSHGRYELAALCRISWRAVARVDPTWHALPVEEVLRALATGLDGLTEAEARERLARPAWTKPAARQQAPQPAAASPPITLPCSKPRPSVHGRAEPLKVCLPEPLKLLPRPDSRTSVLSTAHRLNCSVTRIMTSISAQTAELAVFSGDGAAFHDLCRRLSLRIPGQQRQGFAGPIEWSRGGQVEGASSTAQSGVNRGGHDQREAAGSTC